MSCCSFFYILAKTWKDLNLSVPLRPGYCEWIRCGLIWDPGDKCDKCQCNSRDTISGRKTNLFQTSPRGQKLYQILWDLRHERVELSCLGGQWTHAFVYSDPRSRPLRQITLGGKFDRGETLYQWIKDQYLDQQSIFTLPWVADCVKHRDLELCYPKMIRLHSKTFSGETEKEMEGRPFG